MNLDNIKIEIIKTGDVVTGLAPEKLQQLKTLYMESNWWSENNDLVDPDLINKIIQGSFCFAVASIEIEHNSTTPNPSNLEGRYYDKIIGMGRAISDGVCDAYIQDVAVLPEFRGNGIGVLIMDELIFYLKSKKINWITLISEPKAVSFYERYGFSLMKDYVPFTLKK